MSNFKVPTFNYFEDNITLSCFNNNLSTDEFFVALAKYIEIFWSKFDYIRHYHFQSNEFEEISSFISNTVKDSTST